ncbi:MAG: hypothetical protein ACLQDY_09650, partial [Streptosporangiaceae bacterium]
MHGDGTRAGRLRHRAAAAAGGLTGPPVAARTTCPCQAVLVQIAVVLAAVAALAWVYLLAGRGGFWR